MRGSVVQMYKNARYEFRKSKRLQKDPKSFKVVHVWLDVLSFSERWAYSIVTQPAANVIDGGMFHDVS